MNADHTFLSDDAAGATSERLTPHTGGNAVWICSRISASLAFLRPGRVRVSRQKPRVSLQYRAAGATRTTPLEQTGLLFVKTLYAEPLSIPTLRPGPGAPATGATWSCLSDSLWPLFHAPSLFICPSGGLCQWVFLNALSPPIAFDSIWCTESVA